MRSILQSLLAIVIAFVYVAGPSLTFEIEHTHEVFQGHGHNYAGNDHDHFHPPCSEKPVPLSDQDERDSDGSTHSHTHVVSVGTDTPFAPLLHNNPFMANWSAIHPPVAISEFAPDGPYFPLIKPPQLG